MFQIHREVLLSDMKISKETKIALYNLLQKYDTIISKSDNDIGQTDLIKMHIATRQDAALIAAWLYTLTLMCHDFLKQEIKNLLDTGIIPKSMSPWENPIVVVKKHTPEGVPWRFCLCIDYRKLNSLLLEVTPEMGAKKGAFALMPLPRMDKLFALLEGARYWMSKVVTTT